MKTYLFLDDERVPSDVTWITMPDYDWDIVRNQAQFEHHVTSFGIPDHISFDNDLGDGMGEGIFCAQWLVDQVLDGNLEWNPEFKFTVHSKNNIAANRIIGLLDPFIQHMNR